MQLTATGAILGLATGLLGVWLFLIMFDVQHNDYRVSETRVACEKARFDADFGDSRGRVTPELENRVKTACGEFDMQSASRAGAELKAKREAEELKKSIEKTLGATPLSTVSAPASAPATAQ